MALRFQPQFIFYLQKLLDLPQAKINGLIEALAASGPTFNVFDLSESAAKRAQLPRGLVEGVMRGVAMLYVAREQGDVTLEKLIDEQFKPAVSKALVPTVADGESPKSDDLETQARWKILRKFVMAALSLDHTVGTAAKAGYVLTEHERIFEEARIMTDIRPIFHLDVSEKPNAAVFVHMLRITARDMFGARKTPYFALDGNDLRSLRQIIDRAITKEATLKSALASSEIEILTPKQIY